MNSLGTHLILELYDCPSALLDNKTYVAKVVQESVERAGCTLLGDISHKFHPQGVTAIALLAESHISIHTWPELGYAAADAFTCGDVARPAEACRFLIDALQAGRHSLRRLARGTEASDSPSSAAEGSTSRPVAAPQAD